MNKSKRQFVRNSSLLASAAVASGVAGFAQAKADKIIAGVLTASETATLEAIADAIVPGAKSAGVAHYIDKQLSAPSADNLLILKYLGVPAPYLGFYQSSLKSISSLASAFFSKPCADLSAPQMTQLLAKLASNEIAVNGDEALWQGPPAPFFFFVLRADACDVVYGTEKGFDALAVPYMAHIPPVEKW